MSTLLSAHYCFVGHIEVKKLKHKSKEEMYQLLEIHLENYDVVPAKLEQCYDTKNHLYRYDMKPAGD